MEAAVRVSAPVRVCDIGGWTDTWFAGHGVVFSIAVQPGVEVRLRVSDHGDGPRIRIDAPDVGDPYGYDPARPPGTQPLLEAAIRMAGLPRGWSLEVQVEAGVPPGAAMGTSAAAVVALLAGITALKGNPSVPPTALAAAAHRVETEMLGWQAGVQDQLAAAHGGVNLFEFVAYPDASVERLGGPLELGAALARRMVVVYLGRPHRSSEVHAQVITALTADPNRSAALDPLRAAARAAAAAWRAGDLDALGRAMWANCAAQEALHPDLLSGPARAILTVAAEAGAAGAKVNGAGGDGGSLTLLAGAHDPDARALRAEVQALAGGHRILAVRPTRRGVEVAADRPGERAGAEG